MRKLFAALAATAALAGGALAVQAAVPEKADAATALCYWPRDSYWHYSPGYNVWFKYNTTVYIYGSYEVIFWIYDGHSWTQWAAYC